MPILLPKPRVLHRKCLDPILGPRGGEAPLPILLVVEEVLLPAQMVRRDVHARPRPELQFLGAIPNYIATV